MKKILKPRSHPLERSPSAMEGSQHGLLHKPVLLEEVVEYLAIKSDGQYVDATFGRGGHSLAILAKLSELGRLYVMDRDEAAIGRAQEIQDVRLFVKHTSFIGLSDWMKELGVLGKIQGILMDLGLSSPQLEDPCRGFSFNLDGPLDMRMDLRQKMTAAEWINSVRELDMTNVFKKYGEERYARQIARAIIQARQQSPLRTTKELADIVSKAHPRWEQHKHPATRVFQAIRIFINNELQELTDCLEQCLQTLTVGGRLLVISFHSLEYGIVKSFIQKNSNIPEVLRSIPLRDGQLRPRIKVIARAIKPTITEVQSNPRSRSAILQVLEKLA